jgi:diguanylate cyclase (GGDEF)-like protein
MKRKTPAIRLPRTIEFRSGRLGFHRSVVLFTVSLVTSLLLLAYAMLNLVDEHPFRAFAHGILLILMLANLGWFRHSLDMKTSTTVFLAIYFGQNALAILDPHFASFGLFWIGLFPLLAFILKGFRRGLAWTAIMAGFIVGYFILSNTGYLEGQRDLGEVIPLLVNYLLMSIISAVLWSWNEQLVYEQERTDQLQYLANHDSLTGLLNRSALLSELEATIESLGEATDGDGFGLMFIDLDGFKQVNDDHGHLVGDKVLTMVAKRLSHALRGTDLIGRYGGDEFLILLRSLSPGDTKRMMQKIEATFHMPFEVDGIMVELSASIGISLCPHDASSIDELIHHADREMYSQKLSRKVDAVGFQL